MRNVLTGGGVTTWHQTRSFWRTFTLTTFFLLVNLCSDPPTLLSTHVNGIHTAQFIRLDIQLAGPYHASQPQSVTAEEFLPPRSTRTVVFEPRFLVQRQCAGVGRLISGLHRHGHLVGRGTCTTGIWGVALGSEGSVLRVVFGTGPLLSPCFDNSADNHCDEVSILGLPGVTDE